MRTNFTDSENSHGLMVRCMKVNFLMINGKATECLNGETDECILVNGIKISNMEKELSLELMEMKRKSNIVTGKQIGRAHV